jgi:hypothetical protein
MFIASQSDYDSRYPTVPLERWKNNITVSASMLGDEKHQAENWFREDRPAWENPNELICDFFDGVLFELFLEDCAFSLSAEQLHAGQCLLSQLNDFLTATPDTLDSVETFTMFAGKKFELLLASLQLCSKLKDD